MLNTTKRVWQSNYGLVISIFAFFGSLFSDAFLGNIGFALVLAGSLFIFLLGYREENKLSSMYETETIPIPIVIKIDSDASSQYVLKNLFREIEEHTKFKNLSINLQKYTGIRNDDLLFDYTGSLYDKDRIFYSLRSSSFVVFYWYFEI